MFAGSLFRVPFAAEDGARRCDLLTGLRGLMHPQQRRLRHVLGLGDGGHLPGRVRAHRPRCQADSVTTVDQVEQQERDDEAAEVVDERAAGQHPHHPRQTRPLSAGCPGLLGCHEYSAR
jgi:hypothetical protein